VLKTPVRLNVDDVLPVPVFHIHQRLEGLDPGVGHHDLDGAQFPFSARPAAARMAFMSRTSAISGEKRRPMAVIWRPVSFRSSFVAGGYSRIEAWRSDDIDRP